MSAKCKDCRAPVLWVEFVSGKRFPLDFVPVAGGQIVLGAAQTERGTPVARRLSRNDLTGHPGPRYSSHLATCPERAR